MSSSPATSEWLANATSLLLKAGVSTARLDCLVLLEDCLNKNRAQLLAHPELPLTSAQLAVLDAQIERRAHHVPLAYLRGKTEFYGRDFIINEDVLEPRPESETMIDLFLQLFKSQRTPDLKVLDIGTGSGALGITAALEAGLKTVSLSDIDAKALAVAKQNAKALNQSAQLFQNDLFYFNNADFDVLLCNLPYVPDSFQINTAALHEPRLAIFGGPDGLDLYRTLFAQAEAATQKPRHILTESMPPQHEELTAIAIAHGYRIQVEADFIQLFVHL
jgi:release factor glutamine methyltransferase